MQMKRYKSIDGFSNADASRCAKETGLTQKTVLSWYDTIRTFLWETFESTGVRIGGPGMTVEIDESAISRRK
uniref:Uncharacterized protein n=1 Tax=Anopheles stephensi TaxID=30069 RepID=A0A182YRE0_ANOST